MTTSCDRYVIPWDEQQGPLDLPNDEHVKCSTCKVPHKDHKKSPKKPKDMTTQELFDKVKPFLAHSNQCDAVQPMWHKGPCDCGFRKLVGELKEQGFDIEDWTVQTS